jgi:hypothetical protein
MTQGRKSYTARALGCLLAAALMLAALAPAGAWAQADTEYQIAPNIPNANDGGSGGKPSGSNGESTHGGTNASDPGASNAVPTLSSDSSDDSGAPILLILLAAIAAVCTGVAVWRLRQDSGPPDRGPGAGDKPSTSAAGETQSL